MLSGLTAPLALPYNAAKHLSSPDECAAGERRGSVNVCTMFVLMFVLWKRNVSQRKSPSFDLLAQIGYNHMGVQ
jgi:hypothetical protein